MRSNFSLNKRENNKIPILKTVRWANCRGIQFIDNEGELLTLLFPLRMVSAEHCYRPWFSFYLLSAHIWTKKNTSHMQTTKPFFHIWLNEINKCNIAALNVPDILIKTHWLQNLIHTFAWITRSNITLHNFSSSAMKYVTAK